MSDELTERSGEQTPGLTTAVMRASLSKRMFDAPGPAVSIDRFQVLRAVGQGAVGAVYEAYDPRLDRRLALKLVRRGLPEDAQALLLDEARTLAQVSHPNVVTLYDAGTVDGQVYIAMEYFAGGSLASWLKSEARSVVEILEVFVQAARGLAAAHAVGVVHRDFKPANVLRTADGRVNVGDFGLARASATTNVETTAEHAVSEDSSDDGLMTSTVAGTPAYMAPEALDGHIDPRSDQFSFCVALWEALFGERPPAGMAALARGEERPKPPSEHDVPSHVVDALLRGLSTDPAERWPSMQVLVTTLERRRATRGWQVAAVLAVGAALGGVVAAQGKTEPDPCAPVGDELAGVWDDDRKRSAAAAMSAVEASYAEDTWKRVEAAADAYADDWEDVRRGVCEASVVRHERSDEAHDLSSACLRSRRDALDAFTSALVEADVEVLQRAVQAAAALPSVDSCDDPERLRAWGLLPPSPETQAEVEEVRRELLRIEARLALGRAKELSARLQPLVARARALDVPHLLAEALALEGRVAQADDDAEASERAYREALTQAAMAGDDAFAADIWPRLVFVVGDKRGEVDQALSHGVAGRIALARVDDDPLLTADLEHALGSVYRAGEDLPKAEEHHRRGLELRRKHAADQPLVIAESLNRLAGVHVSNHEAGEAIELLEQVQARYVEALGPDHPRVGAIAFNLGQTYGMAGRMDDAVTTLRRGVTITRAAHGPDHMKTIRAMAALGTFLGQSGEVDEGIAVSEEVLTALERTPDSPTIPMLLNNLGGLYHEAERLADSLDAHAKARDWLKDHGKRRTSVYAMNTSNLALMEMSLERYEPAEAHFLEAIEVYEEIFGKEHPALWRPNAMLARLYRTTERSATALPYAERAVKVLEGSTSDPNEVADAEFELAQIRWNVGRRGTEVTALAKRARDRWRDVGLDDYAKTVDAWLEDKG